MIGSVDVYSWLKHSTFPFTYKKVYDSALSFYYFFPIFTCTKILNKKFSMDYLQTISQSAPIHNAIRLIQNLPATHRLEEFYKRASRNELIFVGSAVFLTLYNLKAYINAKRQKLNLPPTVAYGLPLVGHTLYLMLSPFKFIDWCNKNYGELYDLNLLGKTITVANKKCAEETFKAESSDLSFTEGLVLGLYQADITYGIWFCIDLILFFSL